jgi:hypothetical protein
MKSNNMDNIFKRINEEPIKAHQHALLIGDFLSQLVDFIDFQWELKIEDTNYYNNLYSVYNEGKTKLIRDYTNFKKQNLIGKVKLLNYNTISEKYYIDRYLKPNGIYRMELMEKINLVCDLEDKFNSFYSKKEKTEEDKKLEKETNKSLLDWLMNLIDSIIEGTKLGHYVKEIIGVIKVFVDGLLLA